MKNVKQKLLEHLNLSSDRLQDIHIHRVGGWLEDTTNPAIWPALPGHPSVESFDPSFPSRGIKVYVDYSIDGENFHKEFDFSEVE